MVTFLSRASLIEPKSFSAIFGPATSTFALLSISLLSKNLPLSISKPEISKNASDEKNIVENSDFFVPLAVPDLEAKGVIDLILRTRLRLFKSFKSKRFPSKDEVPIPPLSNNLPGATNKVLVPSESN
ncbi:MAG: hypothetical protein ACD_12C00588G0001 [uncultured bacterium]|nr:MAG: hypothetical protein ACD_12C00588G0001 [uncultured bacterium]